MIFLSRLIAASAYAGAAFLFGMFLGERGELGFVQYIFAAAIPVTAIVLAIVSRRAARPHVAATGLAMLAGLLLGQQQYARAFDDCVIRASRARTAVLDFHKRHDVYPASLSELEIDLPCRAGFRTTILRYLSNERGFRLWFTNDRQTFVATEKIPFSSTGRSSDRPRT